MPPAQATVLRPGSGLESAAATAVVYLRVSSDGQMNKAHDPEGYSIPGQREACQHRAGLLEASVAAEYVEYGVTGRNVRRPALQRMLAELELLRPDYVIVYDISRLARNRLDDANLLLRIEQSGARLVSVLENIDATPAGRLTHGVLAAVNEFRSAGDAEKVKMGLSRKHADGGTISKAPIGYINTRARIEGREVRTVEIDPDRAPLVRMAFDLYATGDYSISEICDRLEEAGLRTPMTAKRSPAPLSRSQVHRMLHDDYYIGVVTWDGAKNPNGRHEPLIDRETFQKVQEILKSAMLSGNRTRRHKHYLRGSLYCGSCGHRMVYHRVRGKGGVYHYFGCLGGQGRRPHCDGRHIQVGLVERAVERFYANVRLTPRQLQLVRKAVKDHADELLRTANSESQRHTARLQELQNQQRKLLHLFYKGAVAEEVLAAEQDRIEAERGEARRWAKAAAHDANEIMDALDEALRLLREPQIAYMQADPRVRRLLNQALFDALIVRDEDIAEATATAWVTEIHQLAGSPLGGQASPNNDPCPDFRGRGFNKTEMVRARGLEPPRANAHRLLRPACLPIPPRPRDSSAYSGRPASRARTAARACIVTVRCPRHPARIGSKA
jgi:site-specific DNA recombinase